MHVATHKANLLEIARFAPYEHQWHSYGFLRTWKNSSESACGKGQKGAEERTCCCCLLVMTSFFHSGRPRLSHFWASLMKQGLPAASTSCHFSPASRAHEIKWTTWKRQEFLHDTFSWINLYLFELTFKQILRSYKMGEMIGIAQFLMVLSVTKADRRWQTTGKQAEHMKP